jgi:hypothetical protein
MLAATCPEVTVYSDSPWDHHGVYHGEVCNPLQYPSPWALKHGASVSHGLRTIAYPQVGPSRRVMLFALLPPAWR